MFDLFWFLRRFRGGGVDGRAELEAELAVGFDLLEEPQREADALVAQAKAEAERRRSSAAEQAAQLVAQAHADAPAEQSKAAAVRLARAEVERGPLLEAARAEAARIDQVARERLPALIAEIVNRILQPPR